MKPPLEVEILKFYSQSVILKNILEFYIYMAKNAKSC